MFNTHSPSHSSSGPVAAVRSSWSARILRGLAVSANCLVALLPIVSIVGRQPHTPVLIVAATFCIIWSTVNIAALLKTPHNSLLQLAAIVLNVCAIGVLIWLTVSLGIHSQYFEYIAAIITAPVVLTLIVFIISMKGPSNHESSRTAKARKQKFLYIILCSIICAFALAYYLDYAKVEKERALSDELHALICKNEKSQLSDADFDRFKALIVMYSSRMGEEIKGQNRNSKLAEIAAESKRATDKSTCK